MKKDERESGMAQEAASGAAIPSGCAYVNLPPSTMLNPVPVVLVSCAERGRPENRNAITVAWAGTVNSDPPMVSISVRKERYSHGLLEQSGEFVINLVDEVLLAAADFCGVRSGREVNKAQAAGFAYSPMASMDTAPAIEGAPASLGCRVRQVMALGSHDLFLAEVTAVRVRADLVDEKGAVHLEKAGMVAYNHGLYQRLGEVLGFFGWSVAREDVRARRMAEYASRREHEKAERAKTGKSGGQTGKKTEKPEAGKPASGKKGKSGTVSSGKHRSSPPGYRR